MRINTHFVFQFLCFPLFAKYLQNLFFLPVFLRFTFQEYSRAACIQRYHMVLAQRNQKGSKDDIFSLSQLSPFSVLLSNPTDRIIRKKKKTANKEEVLDYETPKPYLLPPFPVQHSRANQPIQFFISSMKYLTVSHNTNQRKGVKWSEETGCERTFIQCLVLLLERNNH